MAAKYNYKYSGKVLENYKKIVAEEMKRQLNKPDSRLSKSIEGRKLRGKDGFGIYMNEYGVNVNQGRTAGKLPNMYKLEDWIDRNQSKLGIKDATPKGLRKVLFAIGNSIKKRGLKPVRFIDIAIENIEPKLTIDLANAYMRDINEIIDESTPNAKKG
jgi:hypothetical protein